MGPDVLISGGLLVVFQRCLLLLRSLKSHQSVSGRICTTASGREAPHRTDRVQPQLPGPHGPFGASGGDSQGEGRAHASERTSVVCTTDVRTSMKRVYALKKKKHPDRC